MRLSTKHGILTEYTSFPARDGMVFANGARRHAIDRASAVIKSKAVQKRAGAASVNQDWNIAKSKRAAQVNRANRYLNDKLENTKTDQVCQIADKAFYRNGNEWTDASLAGKKIDTSKAQNIKVSSPEFQKIVTRLVADHRQSCLALSDNIRITIDQKTYLIQSGK